MQSPSPSGPAQTCALFPEATSRHFGSFGNMITQENWRGFLQKPVHKKLSMKSIVKLCIKSIAVIASITAGSQLSAEALPSRADAWNYGECNSGTFLYVKGTHGTHLAGGTDGSMVALRKNLINTLLFKIRTSPFTPKNTCQVAWILNSDLNMAPLSEGIQAITRKPLLPSEQVQMRA